MPDVSGSTVMTAPASERMDPILPCRDLDEAIGFYVETLLR